jgi:hypothetical protein
LVWKGISTKFFKGRIWCFQRWLRGQDRAHMEGRFSRLLVRIRIEVYSPYFMTSLFEFFFIFLVQELFNTTYMNIVLPR